MCQCQYAGGYIGFHVRFSKILVIANYLSHFGICCSGIPQKNSQKFIVRSMIVS